MSDRDRIDRYTLGTSQAPPPDTPSRISRPRSAASVEAAPTYVVMSSDRHNDPMPFLFADRDTAMEWARAYVREHLSRPEDLDEELTAPMREAGWLYYGQYSVEGDHVFVIECEVQ